MFVGLGDPFEGPAALEALANGCYFINPKVGQEPGGEGVLDISLGGDVRPGPSNPVPVKTKIVRF